MNTLSNLIPLLHEIIVDFVVVFLGFYTSVRRGVRNGSVFIQGYWQKIPALPLLSAAHQIPPYKKISSFPKRYLNYLVSIYNELSERADEESIPLYFFIAMAIIIISGTVLFYIALIY